MRDLVIYSDQALSKESVAALLKNELKSLTVLDDSESHLYIKKKGEGIEIDYTPDDKVSDPDSFCEDIIDLLPNKNAFISSISCTGVKIAKRVVRVLLGHFSNVYIEDDYGWFGKGEDFLLSDHQEKADKELEEKNKTIG
ncbi:MAG: hypothetical protein MJ238_07185 [Bacilli bacterium]|nr:hypothetical protein [Bacilli bacterium]